VPLVTRDALRNNTRRLHILLVEGNVVHQSVATRILENQGYSVALATNDQEVLAMLQQPCDLVLMDAQIPEMKSFAVTAAIRAQERQRGGHIPIVATLANAVEGDQERCLNAGMDTYIDKPFKVAELLATIEACVSQASTTDPTPSPPHLPSPDTCASENTDSILSWEAGLAVVEGDEALYRELLVIFRDSVPMQLESLQEALRVGNMVAVEQEAHSLKSAAANIGARTVAEAARSLEQTAKQHDVDAAHRFSAQLRSAFTELLMLLDVSGDEDNVR
jgi:two-component system, sensor histidine kinase and response regulator